MKLNILGTIVFIIAFLAISFVVRNFVLQQTFDIVNELVILVTTLAMVLGAQFITQKTVHKPTPIEVKI